MANSPLDFPSSQTFRNRLIVRNLAPYPKSPRRVNPPTTYEIIQSDLPVIDSPDELIDQPTFANTLYPLNQYGANNGYEQVRDPNTLQNTNSNEGEYGFDDVQLLQSGINEAPEWKRLNPYGDGTNVIDSAEIIASLDIFTITRQNQSNAQPYPTTFVSSFYAPASILLGANPRGSNGSLSQDSFLAKLGANVLRKEFQDRIAREIKKKTIGRANIFNANSGTDVLGLVTGTIPLIEPNYQITVPLNPIVAASDLALRLAGSIIPISTIPGSYFDPSINPGQPTTIQQLQNAYNRTIGQTVLGQILGAPKSGSQLFLNNTGAGQKARLFKNLDFNKFKPNYERNFFDRVSGAITGGRSDNSDFYIGSTNSDPSRAMSPSGSLPVDEFGREVQAPVYGPTELAKLYEGEVSKNIKLGANGPIYSDGGGIEGGFTWVSPKYKGNAGKYVGPGGDIIREDEDFKSASFGPTESTKLEFKPGSILDETQRLVNSQPDGSKRYQHVGNAIDQVSKIFHDGYREMTKGSKVLSYVGDIGQEKGSEYCRVFTKDTPYLQYNDLQKTDGITTEGRRFAYSVLDKTYNLNIAPNKREGGQDSTNLVTGSDGQYAKKYMFSLENLAWRTSNRPGYTVSDLPICERGPNGGRVMWFPPYELKFTEGSTANWKSTDFLGRPEPVYTYNNTSRTGSLSWKIIVDHPSSLNVVVNKVLANENNKERIDSILESFFAGCRKYDLYDLAKKYYNVNPNDILEIQKEIQTRQVPVERIKYVKQQLTTNIDAVAEIRTPGTPDSIPTLDDYKNIGGYFENDIPKPNQDALNFKSTYTTYTTPSNINTYATKCADTRTFFSTVVTPNYNKLDQLAIKIGDLLTKYPGAQNTITIKIDGSASAPATQSYNKKLSVRRINSLKQFFIDHERTKTFYNEKRLLFIIGNALGETGSPQAFDGNGNQITINAQNCSDEKGDTSVPQKDVFTIRAMACRRAVISDITVKITPDPPKDIVVQEKVDASSFTTEVDVPKTEVDSVTVTDEIERTVIRDNVSKRILRSLLSECDYFEVVKEQTPMVYDNLREKLKFFNPAFHSMTPEGLNSRLTFLQQCLRPGDTIPVIQEGGKLEYNNASNTAFGAPPVLVLRVGDFYHTKIIPDNLQLTYEGLDMNPEGIGVQPMIANVTLSFKFIGGQGLAGAVDKIQNALSFNYYANTEIYDDRADVTDTSYQVIDKDLLDYFNITVPPPNIKLGATPQTSTNNQTIGTVLSATTTESGETGTIEYRLYMNGFIQSAQDYFTSVMNKNKEILAQYNNAVREVWGANRNYQEGRLANATSKNVNLFGKPKDLEKTIESIFSTYVTNITNDEAGLIKFIKGTPDNRKDFSDKVIRALKESYKKVINELKGNFQSSLNVMTQSLVSAEQQLINNCAKNNVVLLGQPGTSGTDGFQESNGFVKVYVTTPTTKVSDSKYTDTIKELDGDTSIIVGDMIDFNNLIQSETSFTDSKKPGVLVYGNKSITEGIFNYYSDDVRFTDEVFQREYFIISQEIIDKTKYASFKQKIIGNILTNKDLFGNGQMDLENQFDGYFNSVRPIFEKENRVASNFLNTMETTVLKKYLTYSPFQSAKLKGYEFTFTTTLAMNEVQFKEAREKLIKSLGVIDNEYKTTSTWADFASLGALSTVVCKVKLN
jgi:hypothetical protein